MAVAAIFALLLCAGTLVGFTASAMAATAGGDVNALMKNLGLPPVSQTATDPKASHLQAAVLSRLGDADKVFDKCSTFFQANFKNKSIDAILRGIQQKPGQVFAVSPATFMAIERASGGAGGVTQKELDLCVRTLDVEIGGRSTVGRGGPDTYMRTLAQIDRSVEKCLQVARIGPPNPAATKIINGLTRRIGEHAFTQNDTLGLLQRAYGHNLNLTKLDLESCAAVFDANAVSASRLLAKVGCGDPSAGCGSGCSFCASFGGAQPICCDNSDSFCSYTCDGGEDCAPYCESSCFPATATVTTDDGGTKEMRDVQVGDRVEVVRADGSLGFEDVYLLTHKDATATSSYVRLSLDGGRSLVLSPRHFIPTATGGSTAWADRTVLGADEVRAGDRIWQLDQGVMRLATVAAATREPADGAFNPLTMDGTIVVDGVVASAHSDWFLDGYVSADTQAKVYQAMFAPVRGLYRIMGPAWTRTISEDWGVVDAAREGTTSLGAMAGWIAGGLLLLAVAVPMIARRRRLALE